jgi:pimeloyl-ACP methyl ester carboxylesterase
MNESARTYVLVPGAWHGAWCWERLTPLLESRGHRVLTPELAGTGGSGVDPASVSLESWARDIVEVAEGEPEPVTLVGHSRGGIVVSRAAELAPDRFRMLVYLAAYLLPARARMATEARADSASLVPSNMIPAREGVTCTLRAEVVRDAFYADCDPATAEWACARLTPEPLNPLVTPLKITPERFGRVSRAYIECSRDRTITLAAQRRMQAAMPCDPVFTLDSGHSPFVSKPAELAALLGRL